MSRAGATKGAKEKTKPAAPQTPITSTEIVPGKFNESDWNFMVDRDNAEEFIFDLVDEVLGNTMGAIYKLYIERQLLPFTITMAKDAILQIIEWQFLARDEGEEGVVESFWTQDEEPDAAVTDCWAQGSVPKTEISMPTPIMEDEDEEEKSACLNKENILPDDEVEKLEAEEEDKVSDSEEPVTAQETADKAAETAKIETEETKKKRKISYKPYKGKLKSAGVSKMTESLDESAMKMAMAEAAEHLQPHLVSSNVLTLPASCASLVKVQNGRPPGSKEVEYDELGNVIAVMRLDAEKLPNHRVSVKYTIVDSSVEAAQSRLEFMRRGQVIAPAKTSNKLSKSLKALGSDTPLKVAGKIAPKIRKPAITPHPPSLLESIDVASGVTVTEAGRTKKGPGRQHIRKDLLEQHQKDLQPVTIKIKSSAISVSDLLDRTTPILRPLDDARPLPPITPKPPILT